MSMSELEAIVLDESLAMFDRYGAIFAVRDKGGDAAVAILAKALGASKSALLKHEVAYVLGQMQNKTATKILTGEQCTKAPAKLPHFVCRNKRH